jgi:hypothetical protein
MDQNTMEQLMEFMKTQIGTLERKMDFNQDKMEAEMKADKEELMAKIDSSQERTDANLEEMKAEINAWLGEMKTWRGVTHACQEEKKESTPKETKALEEPQEVPEGATDAETLGATEDRAGELHLAVRCRGRLKTRTKRDGRLRQECAATIGRPTRRFVPALRKGGLRKGPGKECRSGIRRPGRTFSSRIDGRSLKQRQIKGNVVRETPEGRTYKKRSRTRPKCNNGIRGRDAGQHRRLEGIRMHRELIRQSLDLEIAKLIIVEGTKLKKNYIWGFANKKVEYHCSSAIGRSGRKVITSEE